MEEKKRKYPKQDSAVSQLVLRMQPDWRTFVEERKTISW